MTSFEHKILANQPLICGKMLAMLIQFLISMIIFFQELVISPLVRPFINGQKLIFSVQLKKIRSEIVCDLMKKLCPSSFTMITFNEGFPMFRMN